MFPGGIITLDIGLWSDYGNPYVYNFNISNQVLVQLILATRGALQLSDQNTKPINYVELLYLCPNLHKAYKY